PLPPVQPKPYRMLDWDWTRPRPGSSSLSLTRTGAGDSPRVGQMNLRVFIGAASLVATAGANGPPADSSGPVSTSPTQSTLAATSDAPLAAAPSVGFIFFPTGPNPGQQRWAVGGVWQVAPMFTANFRLGLGSGFAFDARATSIFVYNQLGAGATWAIPVGPFHLGL